MAECIYCRKEVEKESEEHTIPQFLGGDYAPNEFQTKDACKKCNNDFGQFVDGAFARNWFISSFLNKVNHAFFDPDNPDGLKPICFGYCDLIPPHIKDNEVCEMWLGRLGEQIYWIRPEHERFSTYVGGDPQKAKKQESHAYFIFSEKSEKNSHLSLLSFKSFFKKSKSKRYKVKKILCGEVTGANISEFGFSEPDSIDQERIQYFLENCMNGEKRKIDITGIHIDFEYRFLAKLSIGIAYSLFGRKALDTNYAKKLYDTLNYRERDVISEINGSSSLFFNKTISPDDKNTLSDKFFEDKYGVMFLFKKIEKGIAFMMKIGDSYQCYIQCASDENLTSEDYKKIGSGRVIILYEPIGECIDMSFDDYMSHKMGWKTNQKLAAIHSKATKCENYFNNL